MAKNEKNLGEVKHQGGSSYKVVRFLGDAPKPKITFNGTLGLRSPFQLNIAAQEERAVDLGIQCDRFLSLLPHRTLFPSREVVCVPNKQIQVLVKNNSDAPLLLEVGDVVLEAVVLEASDFVVA
jgi:hypothetical protein